MRFGNLEFEATPIANVGNDGTVHSEPTDDVVKSLRGNEGWHHDSTYMPLQAKGAVFSAEIVPSHGAATGWADMRAAYDALDPAEQERLAGLRACHSLFYSQGRAGYLPSQQNDDGTYGQYGYHDRCPPATARQGAPRHRSAEPVDRPPRPRIEGMEPDESEKFLDELNEWACQGERTYHHQWEVGDAVDLGQPPPDAPGNPVRHDRAPAHVAHPDRRRTQVRAGRQPPLVSPARRPDLERATKYLAWGWWQMIAEVVCSGWYCQPVSSLTSMPMRPASRSAATVALSSRSGQAG